MKVRRGMRYRFAAVVDIAVWAIASAASANNLINGGFETPALGPGAFSTISPGSEPAGFAWKVASGDVNLANLPVTPFVDYPAYEGVQALDLNGSVPGAISQDFPTIAGLSYALSLTYADNPFAGGTSTASIKVSDVTSAASLLSTSISHSTSTNSPSFADWVTGTFGFTAMGATTRLTLTSTSLDTGSSGGIILDAVDVHAVPEPATVVLLLAAILSFVSLRRNVN